MRAHALSCGVLSLVVGASACRPNTMVGPPPPLESRAHQADVLVYGGTPAGIAAALAAARMGRSVLLVQEHARLGGLLTNGLSHSDFRTFESLTGAFERFTRAVAAHYADTYGAASPQARDSLRGTQGEPRVNELVLERMLTAEPRVRVWRRHRLVRVVRGGADARRLTRAIFIGPGASSVPADAAMFIDATYEGDLMARAGERHRVGREGRDEYGETLAPARPDGELQAYNFRLTMTREASKRVPAPRPPGYQRDQFSPLVPLLREGRFEAVLCERTTCIYKAQLPGLPNGKFDVNDMSHGRVRLSLPGANLGWPEGGPDARARIFAEHLRHNLGLLHFLQTDAEVPDRYRSQAQAWGLCADELVASGHLPEQLYVREARRLVGGRVFTQRDTEHAPADARAALHRDAIAIGDYGPNCHGTAHEGPRIGGRHTGEFYQPSPPYQIPYGTMVPLATDNLLVPVAVSASHVGFAALRMEPIWTGLGQAAGLAAHVALALRTPVQRTEVARVQALLHGDGAATTYVSDVLPGHPDFAAVQWWATAGGLHGLAPSPEKPGKRGAHLTGQYYAAFPDHAAGLETPLDPELRERWLALARRLGCDPEPLAAAATRGQLIRQAYDATHPRGDRRP